jgi:pimeloyl-ACP methyl ester carboxylesterase
MSLRLIQNSTIVRTKTRVLRSMFAALEVAAPGVGARLAERIWFTLPAQRPPSRRSPSPPPGVPFEVTFEGHVVRGSRWGSGPVVYLVHGWAGRSEQFSSLVLPLVEAGFTVVAHDAPSHGASDPGPSGPRSSDVVEFGKALDAVAAKFGPAYAIVAHSMGAAAAALTLEHGWLATERLVLIAPMVDVASFIPAFQRGLGFGRRTLRRLDHRVTRRVGLPAEEVDMARLLDLDPPDLVVVHDREDTETAYDASLRLVGRWPGARLMTTHGLGHNRILRDPAVVGAVMDHLVAMPATEIGAIA